MSYGINRVLLDRAKGRARAHIGDAAWTLLGPNLQRGLVAERLLESLADGEANAPGYEEAVSLANLFLHEKMQ